MKTADLDEKSQFVMSNLEFDRKRYAARALVLAEHGGAVRDLLLKAQVADGWAHVAHVGVYGRPRHEEDRSPPLDVTMHLSPEHRDTTFVSSLAALLDVPVDTRMSWDRHTLTASLFWGPILLEVFGYRPAGCRSAMVTETQVIENARIDEQGRIVRTIVRERLEPGD